MSLQAYFDQYNHSGIYPFHMPGHKRRGEAVNAFDYTEVEGLDDLYRPEGILKDLQDKIQRLYGTRETLILVNGSTVGILTAVTAVTGRRERILIARNCHKSVYNAVFLWELEPSYILPRAYRGIFTDISPEAVSDSFRQTPDIRAVVLTSPTYEGAVSDIAKIAEICHENNAVLIVDEAHGSHLKFGREFPQSAVDCGADIVIQSVHKTLPALTGTALLHICSDRISSEAVRERLQIFQTSSPSYVLTSSVDTCFDVLEKDGERLFFEYGRRLERFYQRASRLRNLYLFCGEDVFAFDRGKLVIMTDRANISGTQLQKILREKYKLETEMSSLNHVIAMTSVYDTDEGFERLIQALEELDCELLPQKKEVLSSFPVPQYIMSVCRAEGMRSTLVPLQEAGDRISAEYVCAYPPGSPLLVPGELISSEIVNIIRLMTANNVKIHSSAIGSLKIVEGE